MERLRFLRKLSGKTLKEVALHFNVSESTISNYENGKRDPDLDTLIEFARFYETTTDYLLGLTDDIDNFYYQKGVSSEDYMLLAAFHENGPEVQDAIKTLLHVKVTRPQLPIVENIRELAPMKKGE